MRFIRKNGRIIPIGDDKRKKALKEISNKDFQAGAIGGTASALFFKRAKTKAAIGGALTGFGLATSVMRMKKANSVGEYVKEDLKGFLHKSAGIGIGTAAGMGSLVGLNKAAKALKAFKKSRKAGKAAVKIAGLIK
jgi:hypothetical protein